MTRIPRTLIGFAVIALLPVAALAQKVTYDYNPSQDFLRFKTFAFKDSPAPESKVEHTTAYRTTTYDDPFVRQRTNASIAAQLEARGLKLDDQSPDLFVTTRRTFKNEYE